MNLLQGAISPGFADGDLLTFNFENAELTLPCVVVPNNPDNIDYVLETRDVNLASTSSWRTDPLNNKYQRFLWQQWNAEHAKSLDDVALCKLYVLVLEVAEPQRSTNTLLCYSQFEQFILEYHEAVLNAEYDLDPREAGGPCLENRFFSRSVEKSPLNWLVSKLPFSPSPVEVVAIPINNRFVLMGHIKIESLHFPGRSNPYSEETLKQFERDLFNEFLNNIRIDYSPELIATINSLKTKTPA